MPGLKATYPVETLGIESTFGTNLKATHAVVKLRDAQALSLFL